MLQSQPSLVEGLIDRSAQLQPNGIDLTLNSIRRFCTEGHIGFDNTERKLPSYESVDFDTAGWAHLDQGSYIVTFNEKINMPDNLIALARPRSSILRSGASIESAVWDAGYSGRSESLLVVFNKSGLKLSKNARIVQLVFIQLDQPTSEPYSGAYQGENTRPDAEARKSTEARSRLQ